MMRTEQEPTITKSTMHEERHDHPAFGTVTMTVVSGGDKTLFGSDLGHGQRIRICVNNASLERGLNRNWIHSRRQIVEFEMSHSQFAQFITSSGNGNGTPVTLKFIRGEGGIPPIKKPETSHETFRREIHDQAKKDVEKIAEQIKRLGELLESDKIGKKELREIHSSLSSRVGNLPGNLAYVVESAEEALEKATSDAKIEVEAFVHATAQRLGLKQINDLALLDNKNECDHIYSRSINQEYPRKCLHCGEPEPDRVV